MNHPSPGGSPGSSGSTRGRSPIADPRLQKEVFGADPETWLASPYAPFGRAVRSTAATSSPASGRTRRDGPLRLGHPRRDGHGCRRQAESSHRTSGTSSSPLGLRDRRGQLERHGAGRYRVQGRADDRHVRARLPRARRHPRARQHLQRPLAPRRTALRHALRRDVPLAISAGTFGIARGAVRAAWEHIEARAVVAGSAAKADPFVLTALARAESDVEASISHVQSIIARFYDTVAGGGDITVKDRLRFRVDQVRATDRAIEAVNELYRLGPRPSRRARPSSVLA